MEVLCARAHLSALYLDLMGHEHNLQLAGLRWGAGGFRGEMREIRGISNHSAGFS